MQRLPFIFYRYRCSEKQLLEALEQKFYFKVLMNNGLFQITASSTSSTTQTWEDEKEKKEFHATAKPARTSST